MGIRKEISWWAYPAYVSGVRHVDTEEITTLIDAKTNLLVDKTVHLKLAEDALAQKSGALNSCLGALSTTGDACQTKLARIESDLITANARLNSAQDDLAAVNDSLSACKLGLDKPPLPKATLDVLNGYYTKYAEAHITSNARYLGVDKKRLYDYDVQNWCQTGVGSIELKTFVTGANAWVWNIMKNETQGDFHNACDLAVARIETHVPVNYHYDIETYGVDDFWAWAIDTYKLGKGDCDDYSAMKYCMMRTAGIPDSMMRIACGNTRGSGEGHSTNFYFASDLQWRHMNSTTSFDDSYSVATKFPLENDPADPMGLQYVWYSYNGDKSWQSFTTGAQAENFARNQGHRLLRRIKIVPLARGGGA